MRTHHSMNRSDRRASAADDAVRQAVQASMDRRDNGGETGHTAA